MAAQSALAKLGQRLGVLGSAASLAICAPLAAGDYSMDAHTDASRMGWYFDRTTPGSQFIGHVVEGVDVLHVATDVIASVVPITAVTNTGYTRLDSTVDAGGNTYFQYDHSDGTILLQSEIMGVFPLMQVNDNTVAATGAEEAFKVTTYASKPGVFQVTNDTVLTGYALLASAGIGNANAIQAYVGAGIGTAAVVHVEDDRATQGYSVDAALAGQARFIGTEYVPQAANPGGANTVWVDTAISALMFGSTIISESIGGTIAAGQVAVGAAPDAIAGSAALTWTAAAGLSANRTAAAGNQMFGSGAGNTTMTGVNNTLVGLNAGTGITSATGCTAMGSGAFGGTLTVSSANSTALGYNAMSSAAVASKGSCTAVGANALAAVTASDNTAVGSNAGSSMTSSQRTTSVGSAALIGAGGTVSDSTAVGYLALTACQAQFNTAVGSSAADAVTTASRIVALGYNSLGAGTTGVSDSTAVGYQALLLCTAAENTALGSNAADAVTTATRVVAVGYNALGAGSTGVSDCTAIGHSALALATGAGNTMVGSLAGGTISTGINNTGVGLNALRSITNVVGCAALGYNALAQCTVGANTAVGSEAAASATSSARLVAVGYNALTTGTTGVADSTAVGYHALRLATGGTNTAVGSGASDALTTSQGTTALGYNALGGASDNAGDCVAIGASALLVCNGAVNTAVGAGAGQGITAGESNVAVGWLALAGNAGDSNVALGANSLMACTVAENTAVGANAADALTTSVRTVSVGFAALGAGTTGVDDCTAIGHNALLLCTGSGNTAVGSGAGDAITSSTRTVAIGLNALGIGSTGASDSTAVGYHALIQCNAAFNTAVGSSAASNVSTATRVVAIGAGALGNGTTGVSDCTAVGRGALSDCTVSQITAVGANAADGLTTSLRVTAIGYNALGTGDTGITDSTAVGHSALALATGANNTAVGALAGDAVSTGASNTLVGSNAGGAINTGSFNGAIGDSALFSCQGGVSNIGLGAYACYSVTSGSNNLGIGTNAVANVGTTNNNVGVGYGALQYTTVDAQVAIGMEALRGDPTPSNNTGTSNVAIGFQALRINDAGSENVAIGYQTMVANTSGSRCVGIGLGALAAHLSGTDNTALGWAAGNLITTGTGNIFLGAEAGDSTDPSASNRMVVGSDLAPINEVYFGNGETNAGTGGVVITVTGGFGTDIDGGVLYLAGGKATGSGTPGFIALMTSEPAGSGSTPQNQQTRVQLDNGGGVAGNTCMQLWDVDHGTLQRVTVGAADSGGTGFKVLRIPN